MTASVTSAAVTRAELAHAASERSRRSARRPLDQKYQTPGTGLPPGECDHSAGALAFDFMRFCQRNPRALPILDVTDPGDPLPRIAAPDADIRADIPTYCIYRNGKMVERVRDCATTGDPITWPSSRAAIFR